MNYKVKILKFINIGIILILLLLSLKFDFYSTKFSIQYLIIIFLSLLIIICNTINDLSLRKSRFYLILKNILLIFSGLVIIAFLNNIYDNQKFYKLNNDYGYDLIIKEWNNQFGTCGKIYIMKNQLLLKKTNVFYSTENGYSPISSNEYIVEQGNESNKVIFKFKITSQDTDYKIAYIDLD